MTASSVITLAFEQASWDQLACELSNDLETAWVGLACVVDTGTGDLTLLVREMLPVPEDAYCERRRDGLSIKTSGWLPAFSRADTESLVPIFVHTHPGGDPTHSVWDDEVDDELARVASIRTVLGQYGSLVVGGTAERPAFRARLSLAEKDWTPVDRVRIVGERLTLLAPGFDDASPAPIFDRQVRAFGADGQAALQMLRVGVVGAGGTGSAVVEQLARLGVGNIVVVDPETLTDTNVTRVYGSSLDDVDRPKVSIAIDNVRRTGLKSETKSGHGEVLDRSIAMLFAHCDVLIGCTDDNEGRVILTRMPQALLQLLVDCGVTVDSREGTLFEIFCRVSVVTPTSACLVCMDDIDLERARAQATPAAERERLVREGYAPELETKDPSVITYTTITAGFAVNEVLSRLFGYCDPEPANRMLIRMGDRSTSKTRRMIRGKHRCGRPELLAVGTREPFLDYGWRDEK